MNLSAAPGVMSVPAPSARIVRRVTLWGLLVNLLLSATKFVTGIMSDSQALVADAFHSLSDSVTDIVVIVGAPFWSAPADSDHPYGHGRIETMVTVVIGVMLGVVGLALAYNALATLAVEDTTNPGWLAFAVACLSIVVKEWLYRWTARVGRRIKSSAMIANAWHHRSDAFSSIPVAVAVLGAQIRPSWTFLDHVAALLVALMIMQATWRIIAPALQQLSEAGVSEIENKVLDGLARDTAGVRSVHGLRTRRLGPGLFVDLHVLVDPGLTVHEGHEIARAVKQRLLHEGEDVVDVLVHIEPFEEEAETRRA